MVRTQVQLTDEQAFALKKLAAKKHKPVAELIRQGIEMFLHSTPSEITDEQRRRAIAAAGLFHSGLSDLSTEHDKYLAEVYNE